ncbi:MAG TPA: methyltransferase domain-containing protein [Bryobacteraceae bacterium]|nr:methyltransferase domain-containing protein [Bryobacteraceae bacterium]
MPLALIALLILSLCPAIAQSTHPLTGRQIAPVMGAGGAGWLDRPEREAEEAPDKAIDLLGLKPGMTVADVGAGTGYMTLRMARRIGPTGKAYAEDLQPQMLEKLRAKAQSEKVANVETVQGTVNDPKLPSGQIDLVLLVDVYHEFSEPQAMLDRIRESLKPDGRLVLLEYRKEDPKIPIRLEHKMSVAEVKTEVEAEGYKLDEVIEKLPRQHIIIFKLARVQ